MIGFEIGFWLALACVVYPYAVYPLLAALRARWRGRPVRTGPAAAPTVSVVVTAYNEEGRVGQRLAELTDLLGATGVRGEVILVTDGATDGTAARARALGKEEVHVLELPARVGKAEALSRGCALAHNYVLVFADVRQSWERAALPRLLENFADPDVGAVSGDLVMETAPGVLAGVGLYWRFEKWLRRQESRAWSTVGVTGAISAVRRELFRSVPAGTLLDDVYWPLQVALRGFRVLHDPRARARDRLPPRARDEFRRKVRTLTGNFQLINRLPAALLPWRNPVWFAYVSHKLCRLLVPWALLGLLATSWCSPGPFYQAAFVCQCLFYLAGLAALGTGLGSRLSTAAGSFLVLNAAAWIAFWAWVFGRAGRLWTKVSYETVATARG